jgi:transcriptional regulator with XRE-family HTH domain
LRNEQFRHAYADEHLNLSIATQIKAIREKQRLTQATLAERIGTKQTGISRIESANYSRWSIAVLRRLAEAFDLRLRVSFEEFGTLWREVDDFSRESLERREFKQDPEFEESADAAPPMAAAASNGVPVEALLGHVAAASAADLRFPAEQSHDDYPLPQRRPVGAAGAASRREVYA